MHTLYLLQRFWPWRHRHSRPGSHLPDHSQGRGEKGERHKRRDACVSPPSYLARSSLSTRLTTNLQVVAGIISLLNDYLLSKGEEPLGFLNYWLYDGGSEAFLDITRGSNPGCETPGFSAIEGWDPVRSTRHVPSSLSTLGDPGLRRSRVSERLT